MRKASTIKVTGHLRIEVRDKRGRLKALRDIDNLVVTAGKVVIANRLCTSPTKNPMDHLAIGTGTNAPAAGDTALQTELARVSLTSATPSSNTVQYVGTFNAGVGTGAITEAGLFNATPAGDMLARTVFTAVTKGGSDVMTITWTVTFS